MDKPDEPNRIRMKVWTNPENNKPYAVPLGQFDKHSDAVIAYAMRDEETIPLKMNTAGWNSLPFHYFTIGEESPRPVGNVLHIPLEIKENK